MPFWLQIFIPHDQYPGFTVNLTIQFCLFHYYCPLFSHQHSPGVIYFDYICSIEFSLHDQLSSSKVLSPETFIYVVLFSFTLPHILTFSLLGKSNPLDDMNFFLFIISTPQLLIPNSVIFKSWENIGTVKIDPKMAHVSNTIPEVPCYFFQVCLLLFIGQCFIFDT